MPASDRNPVKATDAELWIGGLRCSDIASNIQIASPWTQPTVSVLSDENRRTQKVLKGGNFQISLFYREETRLQNVMEYWDLQPPDDPLYIVWGIQSRIAVGKLVGVACVEPGVSSLAGTADDVFRLNLDATLASPMIRGVLRSSQTRDGREPMFSGDTADYASQHINVPGPAVVNTSTFTQSRTGHGRSAIIATVGSITGEDGTRPRLTFNIPGGEQWRNGELTVNDAKSLTIGHTVDGTLINKTVPQGRPNYFLHETVATVYEDIENLTWPDGFHIFQLAGGTNQVIFEGSLFGRDSDLVFAAGNEIPTGAPFRGTANGTDGGAMMSIFTATGSGGSTVRTGQGKAIPVDGGYLPATQIAILDDPFTQVGAAFSVPARSDSTSWDFTPHFSVATVTDGDLVA